MLSLAPGTYSHSISVANLAESACSAMGANPLLARVGAYYHDIGKIARPYAFIENQIGGDSFHERLDPVAFVHRTAGHPVAETHQAAQPAQISSQLKVRVFRVRAEVKAARRAPGPPAARARSGRSAGRARRW